MGRWNFVLAAAVLLAVQGSPSSAQADAAPTASEVASRPAPIPVKAFASRSELTNAVVSPKGASFAFTLRSGDQTTLSIHDAATLEAKTSIAIGETTLNWFRWAGEDRILISVVQVVDNALNWGSLSRLMVYDLKTKELRFIGFRKQGAEGDDVLFTDPNGEYVVLSVSPNLVQPPEVWRFPLDGSGEDGAELIQDNRDSVEEWWADDTGTVRLGMGWTRTSTTRIYYRSGPGEEFRQITKLKDGADELENWDIIGIYAGSHIGYALSKGPSGRRALREMNYSTGELGKIVFEDPQYDIEEVLFDRNNRPAGYRVVADSPRTVWIDPEMARLQKGLEKVLSGSNIRIFSRAEDKGRMLVAQQGHADPGAVYVFTAGESRLDLFANLRPEIDYRVLSSATAHTIKARDGVEMRAYLTLPRGREAKALPLIVMPHGGPYGVRDSLKYDDWVQLLANRGYAVLQPNYRGSGGYGEAFERLGDGQIGRAMQDDLDDATQWAIARGYADPARVCVVGAAMAVMRRCGR